MTSKEDHLRYQESYFDEVVDIFCRPIPEDVAERTRDIATFVLASDKDRILDVGTGTGVLIGHFKALGVQPESIVACDLSEKMLAEAARRHPGVRFIHSDVDALPRDIGLFDIICFNGCFVNMFDQFGTVAKCAGLLKKTQNGKGGRIAISHPMGRKFTEELKAQAPDLVAKFLPDRDELSDWCKQLGLSLSAYRDEARLYLAVLESQA